jgi:ribosomal protein L11 methyltransferase
MLYAELDAFEPVAIHEHETGGGWRVFFRTPILRDAARGTLAAEFGNALLDLVPRDIDDEDWARRSQASLTAIRAGRIVVAPPWDVPDVRDSRFAGRDSTESAPPRHPSNTHDANCEQRTANRDIVILNETSREPRTANRDIVIVIDPSTGFGTGHHATTRLCLELLQRQAVGGRRVIDVGTGSGVLALAAWKLGADRVIALDNDPDALQNAGDNVNRNGGRQAIEIVQGDLSSALLEPADVVVANLTGAVLQRYGTELQRLVLAGGALIVSGFGGDELEDIVRVFGTVPTEVLREAEWAAASFQRV